MELTGEMQILGSTQTRHLSPLAAWTANRDDLDMDNDSNATSQQETPRSNPHPLPGIATYPFDNMMSHSDQAKEEQL